MHAILAGLFEVVASDPALGRTGALELLPDLVDRACERAEADGITGYGLAWAVRRRQMLADLRRAIEVDPCWNDGLRPARLGTD